MNRVYIHKKTGNRYELVQEKLKVKDWNGGSVCKGENEEVFAVYGPWLQWNDGFVLFKALYENPDGPYFVRRTEDFFENFVPEDEPEFPEGKEMFEASKNWSTEEFFELMNSTT